MAISYTQAHLDIINSRHVTVHWLWETSGFNFSTEDFTFDGINYTAAVNPSFAGVKETRAKSEFGIISPNDINFIVGNPGNTLSINDFKTGDDYNNVTLRYVLTGDSGTSLQFRVWTFKPKKIKDVHQRLHFDCEDYLKFLLNGVYPNTPLFTDLSQTSSLPTDDYCIPKPFGTAFIPLRPYFPGDNEAYYILGPSSAGSYDVSEVRSPEGVEGEQSKYLSSDYAFTYSDKTINGVSYRVFQPKIHKLNDGTYGTGVWRQGGNVYDILAKFTLSTTENTRNFPDVFAALLQDFSAAASLIDSSGTFATLETLHASRGITFDYGFHRQVDRKKLMAQLLNACNACLIMTDKLEIYDLDRVSQATINDDHVYLVGDDGASTFKAVGDVESNYDSARIAMPAAGAPQTKLTGIPVDCVAGVSNNRSTETLEIPFYTDTQIGVRAGQLHYQRKYYGKTKINYDGIRNLIRLQLHDIQTINYSRFGGNYNAVTDETHITGDGFPKFTIISLKNAIQNWDDYTPPATTIVEPDIQNYFSPNTGGYSDGAYPANVTGLIAEGWIEGVKFIWDKNPADDFQDFIYQLNITNNAGTSETGWSSWYSTTNNYLFRFLTESELTTYGDDAIIYIRVRGRNKSDVQSPQAAEANAKILSINFPATTIDDFSITATKLFTKTIILEGDAWTNNSPSSNYISWNQHTLVFNGNSYTITPNNTSSKYVYWLNGNSYYSTSSSYPSLGDNDFMIATNISGVHDLAWNAIANEVIGTAHIMQAAITAARIADLAVTTAKINNLAVSEGKIANLAVTNAKINDLNASKINAGYLAAARIEAGTVSLSKLTGADGTLTISASGQIEINSSLGIVINDGGGVTIYEGGDLFIAVATGSDDDDRGMLKFEVYGGEEVRFASDYDDNLLCIFPTDTGTDFIIGRDYNDTYGNPSFENVIIRAQDFCGIRANGTVPHYHMAYVSCEVDESGGNKYASAHLYARTSDFYETGLEVFIDTEAYANTNRNRERGIFRGACLLPYYDYDETPAGMNASVLGVYLGDSDHKWRGGFFYDITIHHNLYIGLDSYYFQYASDIVYLHSNESINSMLRLQNLGSGGFDLNVMGDIYLSDDLFFGSGSVLRSTTDGTGYFGTSSYRSAYVYSINAYFTNLSVSGSKSFRIDHPVDPTNKFLQHACIESPQIMNAYKGKSKFFDGTATIDIDKYFGMTPGTFAALNKDADVISAIVQGEFEMVKPSAIKDGVFTLTSEDSKSESEVVWMVTGVRKDPSIMVSGNTDQDGNLILEIEKEAPDLSLLAVETIETEDSKEVGQKSVFVGELRECKGFCMDDIAYPENQPYKTVNHISKKTILQEDLTNGG